MQIDQIIDRLEFIKGNIIADQRRDALQQIKELLDLLFEAEQKELSDKAKIKCR